MLNEKQLGELIISISNRIGSNLNYLPIIGTKNEHGIPYILVTKSGYTFQLEENGCVIFKEVNLDLEDLIFKIFRSISYDVFMEKYRKVKEEMSCEENVSEQREKRFMFQIEFLGKINQSYSERISEEIRSIKDKYPL